MRSLRFRTSVIAIALFAAGALAAGMKPTQPLALQGPRVDLERMIPVRFGEWRAIDDPAGVPVGNPQLRAELDRLYDQVLARTYVDGSNRRVMLSIAYGSDQLGDGVQAHRPEFCYAAQGFVVRTMRDEALTDVGGLPVRRLVAQRLARREPITYWITIGDHPVLPGIERKLAQLRFGLAGTIPDGMLVRVSSFDADPQAGYALQDAFVAALLQSLPPETRARLRGGDARRGAASR